MLIYQLKKKLTQRIQDVIDEYDNYKIKNESDNYILNRFKKFQHQLQTNVIDADFKEYLNFLKDKTNNKEFKDYLEKLIN